MGGYNLFLFDADGTLFDFEAAEHLALEQTLTRNGILCDEAARQAYERINSALWLEFERGELEFSELGRTRFAQLTKELKADAEGETLNTQYLTLLSRNSRLLSGAPEVCRAFAAAGRLALVTNGFALAQHCRFDHSEIRPYFEAIFVSEDVGFQKPQTAYFDYVFDHLGVADRSGSIIIGDSLSSDICGGNNAGIDTCWLNLKGLRRPEDTHCTYEAHSLAELPQLLLG